MKKISNSEEKVMKNETLSETTEFPITTETSAKDFEAVGEQESTDDLEFRRRVRAGAMGAQHPQIFEIFLIELTLRWTFF